MLAPEAFVLRYATPAPGDERLLIINLGPDLTRGAFPEPLLAPPGGCVWRVRWSSEDPAYGGAGVPEIVGGGGWRIPGHSAIVLAPVESTHAGTGTR